MQLDKTGKNYIYTDEQLIARFQGGDEQAYIELVNRYRNKLMNFVYRYIGDFEISEDIVQDTMVKLYQKKHYYKEIAKFSTWLYTIAKNLARTELRKKKQRRRNHRPNPPPHPSCAQGFHTPLGIPLSLMCFFPHRKRISAILARF